MLENGLLDDSQQLAKDLLKTGFAVSADIDEDQMIIDRYKNSTKNPKDLGFLFAPSFACNFDCPYCYESRENKSKMDEAIFENLKKFISSQIREHNPQSVLICWYGGEPMLYPEYFIELNNYLKANHKEITLTNHIISNGSLFREKLKYLAENISLTNMQITLHGSRDFHNKARGYVGGKDSYDDVIDGIKYAREIGIPSIAIRVNMDRDNKDSLPELLADLRNNGLSNNKQIKIYPYPVFASSDNSDKYSHHCVPMESYFEAMSKWIGEIIEFGFLDGANAAKELFKAQFVPGGACGSHSYGSFVIAPDGSIGRCWNHIGQTQHSLGHVNRDGFFYQDKLRQWHDAGERKIQACVQRKCPLTPICSGGCFSQALRDTGDLGNPSCTRTVELVRDFLAKYTNYSVDNNLTKETVYKSS